MLSLAVASHVNPCEVQFVRPGKVLGEERLDGVGLALAHKDIPAGNAILVGNSFP
jgi:hypothetical protein